MINRLKVKRADLVEELIDLKEEITAVEGKIALLDEIIEEEEEAAADTAAEVETHEVYADNEVCFCGTAESVSL